MKNPHILMLMISACASSFAAEPSYGSLDGSTNPLAHPTQVWRMSDVTPLATLSAKKMIAMDIIETTEKHHHFSVTPPVSKTWDDLLSNLTNLNYFPNGEGNAYTVPFFIAKLRSIEQKYLSQNPTNTNGARQQILDEQMTLIASTWTSYNNASSLNEMWGIGAYWNPIRYPYLYQFIYNRANPTNDPKTDNLGCCSSLLGWL